MMNVIAIYLGIVLVMSLACFVAYGWDKGRAANGGRRVPEQTLHTLALLGGWPGALVGQRYFRHKTKKLSFLIVFWCVVVLHVAIVGTAAYVFFGNPSNSIKQTRRFMGRSPRSSPFQSPQRLRRSYPSLAGSNHGEGSEFHSSAPV